MLVVDGLLTVATWLPYNIFLPLIVTMNQELEAMYRRKDIMTIETVLGAIMFTNVFSTPFVYFIFNKSFRVSTKKHFKIIVAYIT